MRRIVVTEFVSLDGVMEEPRWTFDFDRGKEGDQFKYEELFAAESLLLGRVPTRVSLPRGRTWATTTSASG